MVEKGLKVGDTFVDGKTTYIVKQVLPGGAYISEKTTKPRPKTREK